MHLFVRFLGIDLLDLVFGTEDPEPQVVNIAGLPISERQLEEILVDDDEEEDRRRIGF